MTGGETLLPAPVIIIAALVIRTALTELHHPGSAPRQWAFVTNPGAVAAGATAAAATVLIGGSSFGWAAAWALLIEALTAFSPAVTPRPSPFLQSRTRSSPCQSDMSPG